MEHLNHLFVEAGTLMLAGMVFVFVFLGLLIVFINTVLAQLAKKYPDPVIQSAPQRTAKKKTEGDNSLSPKVVAAISSAVTRYRQQHNKN